MLIDDDFSSLLLLVIDKKAPDKELLPDLLCSKMGNFQPEKTCERANKIHFITFAVGKATSG